MNEKERKKERKKGVKVQTSFVKSQGRGGINHITLFKTTNTDKLQKTKPSKIKKIASKTFYFGIISPFI